MASKRLTRKQHRHELCWPQKLTRVTKVRTGLSEEPRSTGSRACQPLLSVTTGHSRRRLSPANGTLGSAAIASKKAWLPRWERVQIHPKLPSQRPADDQLRSSGSVPSTHGGKTEVMKPSGKDSRSQLKKSWDHFQVEPLGEFDDGLANP